MLNRIILPAAGIVIISIILIFTPACEQRQITEQDVLVTLDSLEQKFEFLEYRLNLQYWDLYSKGKADSIEFYQKLHSKFVNDEPARWKLQAGRNLLSGEEDRRRRDILLAQMLYGAVEDELIIANLRDSLSQQMMNLRVDFEGEQRPVNYLSRIMRYEPNRRRRESAFRAWISVGDQLGSGLEQLFRHRNQAAKKLGYNSFLALVFNNFGLSMDEYRSYLDRLETLSRQPYSQLLDRIKTRLNVDQLEYWDLWYAYADINQTVDRYFPADSQMNYIKQSLKTIGFNLDKLPIYFDLEEREGKAQSTFSIPVKPPLDVRVLTNLSEGMLSTKLLMHEIGHSLHFTHITQERELFIRAVDGAWAEGMATIITSLLMEKDWLTEYAKMPPQLAESYISSMKEQDLISLRRVLLLLEFEFEAYQNPNRDINKLYWDLFVKHMLLPRHEEFKHWATVTHYVHVPVYMQNYLYADMISAQTMATLRARHGTLINNTAVGAFLIQNYYRFGGRYDWRELLARGTDREFSPDYLINELGL